MNTDYMEETSGEAAKATFNARREALADLRDLLAQRVPEVTALVDLVREQGSAELRRFFDDARACRRD